MKTSFNAHGGDPSTAKKKEKRNPGSLPVQLASVACTLRHVIHLLGSCLEMESRGAACWYEQSNASAPTHKRGPRNINQSALTVEIFQDLLDRRASPDWRSWNRQARKSGRGCERCEPLHEQQAAAFRILLFLVLLVPWILI